VVSVLIATPFLVMFLGPFVRRFLPLANFLVLPLVAASPFLIAVLVWRIKLWLQGNRGTPLAVLPTNNIST